MSQTSQDHEASQTLRAPYVLALDIGTSSVRALLFDAAGRAVPHIKTQLPYELTTSGEGEACVDADKLVQLVAQSIDGALQAAGSLVSQIVAVATDTFWHSLVAVAADGRALTPVLTWEDNRSRNSLATLVRQLDPQDVHQRTGARLHTSYWPAKLRWLAETAPDIFAQTAQWLSFGEYLHRRLLGESVCSLSMASATGMMAIRKRAWDAELQRVTGTRPEQFPSLGDLGDSISGLLPDYASRWPFLKDVLWFPAIGDGAAANVGSGCLGSDQLSLTIGTSSAMRVIVSPDEVESTGGLWLYLLDANRALLGGALSEGGNLPAWLEATLKLHPLVEAEAGIASLTPDAHGLTILPFITGERSPGWHAQATMGITGLNAHTTPIDLLRASLEAIAYQLRAVYDALLQTASRLDQAGKPAHRTPVERQRRRFARLTHLSAHHRQHAQHSPLPLARTRSLGARRGPARARSSEDHSQCRRACQRRTCRARPPDEQEHEIYVKGAERQQKLYNILLEKAE